MFGISTCQIRDISIFVVPSIYISQSSCSGGTCTGRAAGHDFFFCVCLNYPEVYRMNMEYETLNDLNLMILVFS